MSVLENKVHTEICAHMLVIVLFLITKILTESKCPQQDK